MNIWKERIARVMLKQQMSRGRADPFILIELSYQSFKDLEYCPRILNAKVQPNQYIKYPLAYLITDPIIRRIQ